MRERIPGTGRGLSACGANGNAQLRQASASQQAMEQTQTDALCDFGAKHINIIDYIIMDIETEGTEYNQRT